ncbi:MULTISPECIES: hypothetical protein [unclassified Pusillimonas]|uniref:hypothetical protein n=1 Tax=unclassified Pusillimonas TaxID=2640016 RepID=UPI000B9D29F9|nr:MULTISPECIES: hypothetical protein [unclassified Pusillimonas]OXR49600.1 hypothetical protein PuT2_07375 [Pusillimonas sp. T2]ROT44385.1 hypothetical protein CHR62_13855 [Pusillimonas sp. NJUB218]
MTNYNDSFLIIFATITTITTIATTLITIKLAGWYKRTRRKSFLATRPVKVRKTEESTLQVWQVVYQQASETLREQVKMLGNVNIAGVAGSVAVIGGAIPEANTPFVIAAVITFTLGLLISLMPITGLADKFKEDLTAVMKSMTDQTAEKLEVRHAFALGKNFYPGILSLSCTGLGISCLIIALLP